MWIQRASLFHLDLWEGDEANDPGSSFQIYKGGDWEQSAYIYEACPVNQIALYNEGKMMPREVVESPSAEMLKTWL